ncbi:MAG: hypothetical protein WA324_09740 [Bryobacteraceae bacterium]
MFGAGYLACRRDSSPAGARLGATRSESTQAALGPETVATIIRTTGSNFRLLNRLLTQMERILENNSLRRLTKAVAEAARESLVIGQSQWKLYAAPLLTF